jgi:hypothetical protein
VFTDAEIIRFARIAHEANRAVQAADGDDMPSLPWMCEPRSLRASTLAGVQRVLAGMTPEQKCGANSSAARAGAGDRRRTR